MEVEKSWDRILTGCNLFWMPNLMFKFWMGSNLSSSHSKSRLCFKRQKSWWYIVMDEPPSLCCHLRPITLLRFQNLWFMAECPRATLWPICWPYKKKGQWALHVYSINNFVASWLKWLQMTSINPSNIRSHLRSFGAT